MGWERDRNGNGNKDGLAMGMGMETEPGMMTGKRWVWGQRAAAGQC